MKISFPEITRRWAIRFGTVVMVGTLAAAGFIFQNSWLPIASDLWGKITNRPVQSEADLTEVVDTAGQAPPRSLELSQAARKNIGLRTVEVVLQDFEKTVSVPAIVVERPGRSQIDMTSPIGGRVTKVYPVEGQAIEVGQPLFDLVLTHEELVNAQSEYLKAAEELDVVRAEIKRLDSVSIPGAIPLKTRREREYEEQKILAMLNAQQQSLVLHGLEEDQVASILKTRKLIKQITVFAPPHSHDGEDCDSHPYHIQKLSVNQGQYVDAGTALCVLADHYALFLEGKAFEEDTAQLEKAANEGWELAAVLMSGHREREQLSGLQIFYLSDVIDVETRSMSFYVKLPNNIVRDEEIDGHRFVAWKFKPGQRMEIRLPVERWENQIVLPVDAVAQEGAEAFVFEQNGEHFDQVPVHLTYKGQDVVVIENDGSLLGSIVAANGAYQMQLALKNQAGGAVDPHAGHNH